MTKSFLDDIKGLGPKKKELIKKSYPTLEKLLAADEYEIAQIVGIELAKEIIKNLQK